MHVHISISIKLQFLDIKTVTGIRKLKVKKCNNRAARAQLL